MSSYLQQQSRAVDKYLGCPLTQLWERNTSLFHTSTCMYPTPTKSQSKYRNFRDRQWWMFIRNVRCRQSYLHDLDITGREPSRYSILLPFPPSFGQHARDADQLPGLELQTALVLLAAERVQTPTQRSRHRQLTSPALSQQPLFLLSRRVLLLGFFLYLVGLQHLPVYSCSSPLECCGFPSRCAFQRQHARDKPKTRSLLDI